MTIYLTITQNKTYHYNFISTLRLQDFLLNTINLFEEIDICVVRKLDKG